MFFYLAKIGWFVLQPLVAIILTAALGWVAVALGFRRTGKALFALAAFVLAVVSLSPLGIAMTAHLENRFERPSPMPETAAGIIVLGGAFDTRVARTRGVVELNEAADRATVSMALARTYPEARLLFTGGVAAAFSEDIPETQSAEAFYLGLGLDPNRLSLEGRARDTFENAVYAKALARPRPGETWLLVTSAYHMPRAVGTFRTVGFDVTPYPVDYRTPRGADMWRPSTATTRNLEKVHFAIREYLGLLAYWLAGRTDALIPSPKKLDALQAGG
ncbi:YdcF family protein [Fulvimarina sp. 2208YS6-2-32]|uniref:YdcF family protein n=1 Tax=Fulvimarina uroteuthidis TaxID=3098149 RepID=A0ABU5I371_9HYPH|nr:YdcF family protein [Fulvimarina sp. 2208YS6-2-32]MDY8109587.1 YdcF family protein [Fulvimarina sp. 2208YS6-2-32]